MKANGKTPRWQLDTAKCWNAAKLSLRFVKLTGLITDQPRNGNFPTREWALTEPVSVRFPFIILFPWRGDTTLSSLLMPHLCLIQHLNLSTESAHAYANDTWILPGLTTLRATSPASLPHLQGPPLCRPPSPGTQNTQAPGCPATHFHDVAPSGLVVVGRLPSFVPKSPFVIEGDPLHRPSL